jgi:hypothetical protein
MNTENSLYYATAQWVVRKIIQLLTTGCRTCSQENGRRISPNNVCKVKIYSLLAKKWSSGI